MQVFSLICWGGRTGKSVTASNSSGLLFASTNHGLRDGTGLVFSGTTAPGNVTFGVTYYAKSLSANTFAIYTEAALTNRVAWSSAGSGVIAKSALMLDYFTQYAGRWGAAGSERCYDGIISWEAARTGNTVIFDSEICELGEAFTDIHPYEGNGGYSTKIDLHVARTTITATINNELSPAFHYGVVGGGFIAQCGYGGLDFDNYNSSVFGFEITGYSTDGIFEPNFGLLVDSMIIHGGERGVRVNSVSTVRNNLIYGCSQFGIYISAYFKLIYLVNNTVTGCGTGIAVYPGYESTSAVYAFNNISLGNTTNWGAAPTLNGASCNAGLSGEAWDTMGTTRITMSTNDFANYAGGNYRPASASSPQVDAGIEYLDATNYDIAGAERPNYNNGGAEAFDVGCYEFDHGYGNHPATATISLSNIVAGSRVLITGDDTSAVLYNDVPGSGLSLSTSYIGNFSVVIRKASESPFYREFSAGGTTVANQTTSIKALQQLDE